MWVVTAENKRTEDGFINTAVVRWRHSLVISFERLMRDLMASTHTSRMKRRYGNYAHKKNKIKKQLSNFQVGYNCWSAKPDFTHFIIFT